MKNVCRGLFRVDDKVLYIIKYVAVLWKCCKGRVIGYMFVLRLSNR